MIGADVSVDTVSVLTVSLTGDVLAGVTEALAGKTDIMFVPVGEFYTIGLRELAGFLDAVKPKVVVPMLYKTGGMTLPVNPLDDFLEIVCGEPPMRVGGRIELSCDDLPDISGCLIFER